MLSQALKRAVDQVASQLESKQLQLQLDLPEDLPRVRIESDAARQIAVILVENAIQSSPPGSEVELAAQSHDPDWVTISVSDAGAGVTAEELGQAFQPGLPTEGELAVVRQLAEAVGGRVWIESELGSGTTVSVQLPVRPESSDPES